MGLTDWKIRSGTAGMVVTSWPLKRQGWMASEQLDARYSLVLHKRRLFD